MEIKSFSDLRVYLFGVCGPIGFCLCVLLANRNLSLFMLTLYRQNHTYFSPHIQWMAMKRRRLLQLVFPWICLRLLLANKKCAHLLAFSLCYSTFCRLFTVQKFSPISGVWNTATKIIINLMVAIFPCLLLSIDEDLLMDLFKLDSHWE